jgi:hypothetical protein
VINFLAGIIKIAGSVLTIYGSSTHSNLYPWEIVGMPNQTLYHLDLAIEALQRSHPGHLMLRELELARSTFMTLHRMPEQQRTPEIFAEYRE